LPDHAGDVGDVSAWGVISDYAHALYTIYGARGIWRVWQTKLTPSAPHGDEDRRIHVAAQGIQRRRRAGAS